MHSRSLHQKAAGLRAPRLVFSALLFPGLVCYLSLKTKTFVKLMLAGGPKRVYISH